MTKNVLIYTHMPQFSFTDGGTVAQYNLAKLLDEVGQNVRIYSPSGICIDNYIFNKFYKDDFPIDDNTVVIYCEGTCGNPLNAKNVVRWMLSELGQNVPHGVLHTWGKNELVYYFNTEKKFYNNPEKIGKIYKSLNSLYIDPRAKQTNFKERVGSSYAIRKAFNIHRNGFNIIHPPNSIEIKREHSLTQCVEFFNECKWFVCYDSLSFYIVIAALCGCIPIVYKVNGLNKKEWIQTSAAAEYCKSKEIYNLYGIAYGEEEMEYAENTLHLVKEQWNDILNFNKETTVIPFIKDIQDFSNMENTIAENF